MVKMELFPPPWMSQEIDRSADDGQFFFVDSIVIGGSSRGDDACN